MGCKLSKTYEDAINDEINVRLRSDRKRLNNEIKMLLLGTGESGKSTIAKQLKILHMDGFSKEELEGYKPVINNNVLTAFRNIILATQKFGDSASLCTAELKEAADYFTSVDPLKDDLSPQVAKFVKCLWSHPAIQKTLTMYSQFQLPDSTFYLADNIERIASPGYEPTSEDILRCRARTTGIVEIEFSIERYRFRVVDVGGQRSERKKWIHCFENVTALIFCVSLSEYDQKLYEDEKVNRMLEALELFGQVCNSEWFSRTDIILFLNKNDLFAEKIKRVNLAVCFPEYTGGLDYEQASTFIKNKFLHLNNPASTLATERGVPQQAVAHTKIIYPHITCATDTQNVKVVFNAAKSSILQHNLEGAGF